MVRAQKFTPYSSFLFYSMVSCFGLMGLTSCAREEAPAEIVTAPSVTPYHTVARGETLSIIAAKYNMNKMALIRINRLKPPYRIFIGQRLIIIPKDANMGGAIPTPAVKPVTSVADTGEVSVKELPQDEKDKGTPILPVMGGGVAGSPTSNMSSGMPTNNTPSYPTGILGTMPSAPPSLPVSEPVAIESGEGDGGPSPMQEASQQSVPIINSGGGMQWPVQGEVIKGFGVDEHGQRNDGINVKAPLGQEVVAVESGKVKHVGNQARGFGNLILIAHPGGKISIYGHLQQTSVKVGDDVSSGQKIGTVGTSGGVSQPQLHFELRQGKSPLNPMEHLK